MGMSGITGGDATDDEKPMSEINTTPLVDVMLVLLILFLITIPVITQSVKVDLPKAANIPPATKPENSPVGTLHEGCFDVWAVVSLAKSSKSARP